MKRIIYVPSVDEKIPDGAYYDTLPVSGKSCYDVLVPDNWDTDGEILHEMNESGTIVKKLDEPAIHHFAGWDF